MRIQIVAQKLFKCMALRDGPPMRDQGLAAVNVILCNVRALICCQMLGSM